MRRRDLIALMGGTPIAWPFTARAQQRPTPVIGWLGPSSSEANAPFLAAFREGLKESGYVEERNVAIVFRRAEGRHERLPALAAELVALKVAVIVAPTSAAAVAAKKATLTIPIAFLSADAVEIGLVARFSRPGGNASGISVLTPELTPKRLEMLRELIPNARSVAFLSNPGHPLAASELANVEAAVRATGLDLRVLETRTASDIEQAFARLAERRPDAILLAADALFVSQRAQIVGLAARHAIPAIYDFPVFAAAGGLISYGPNIQDVHRLLGGYVGKILSGARPADLPVQRPTKFELVINLRTARALGLTVPTTLLARADEVIE